MKKSSILIGMLLLFLQAANAQNQKGDQTLGIGLGFSSGSGNFSYLGATAGELDYGNSQFTGFSTNPSYSYFIANNIDIGASMGFGTETSNYRYYSDNSLTKQIDKNYFGSVYIRKYFLFNNKIGIRTGPYLGYQYYYSNVINTPNTNNQNNNSSGNNYHAGIIADFVYYPSGKIGLAVNLGSLTYNRSNLNTQGQGTNDNGVNLSFLNSNLTLSAFYVFGK